MIVEYISTKELIPYALNTRKHSEKQIKQIASSIKEFGFNVPLLIDAENVVISGHGRLAAAELIGMETVPCIRASHLNELQRKAYGIVDNQLTLNSEWNLETLDLELSAIVDNYMLDDFGLEDLTKYFSNFEPVGIEDQGKLDQKQFHYIECPHCLKEFEKNQCKIRTAG